jgi:hypothetical protein
MCSATGIARLPLQSFSLLPPLPDRRHMRLYRVMRKSTRTKPPNQARNMCVYRRVPCVLVHIKAAAAKALVSKPDPGTSCFGNGRCYTGRSRREDGCVHTRALMASVGILRLALLCTLPALSGTFLLRSSSQGSSRC